DGLEGFLEYSTELFDTGTIARLKTHYETLLQAIVNNPEQPIAHLQLLPQQEQHQLLSQANPNRVYTTDRCLHELVAAQCESTPGAVALVFQNQTTSYRELNNRANQLAHYLSALGVGPDVLVGVFMERTAEMLVGLLAILKAGGAY